MFPIFKFFILFNQLWNDSWHFTAFFCYLEKQNNNEDSSDAEYLDSEVSDDSDTDESGTDNEDDHENVRDDLISAVM